jgi:arylsulfatase A-like enzyme
MLQQGVERWHSGSAGLLNGSKGTTYEGGFRVPAIIRWPGQISNGQVSNEVVTTMDLFATLTNIAGAEVPDDREIDGNNVHSILKGESNDQERIFFYLRTDILQAVRKGNWKLRFTRASGYELFDLENDPAEMYNMAEENQELVDELYQELVNFATETNARMETNEN